MKENIKNIEPGIGLGQLKFGMAQDEVKSIIGLPNEIEIYQFLPNSEESEISEIWHFEDLELSISFSSEDDWRMDTISINSNYYSLWNSIEIGQTMSQVEKTLKRLKKENYICEDWSSVESPDHKLFEFEEYYFNLWFDKGALSEIQWSPKFLNDDEVDWPHKTELKANLSEFGFKRHKTQFLFDELEKHITKNLNQVFDNTNKYKEVINDFPPNTKRENLKTKNREIKYYLKMEDRVKGSILAKARLLHDEIGDIGWMAVEWENDLNIMDDFLVIEE